MYHKIVQDLSTPSRKTEIVTISIDQILDPQLHHYITCLLLKSVVWLNCSSKQRNAVVLPRHPQKHALQCTFWNKTNINSYQVRINNLLTSRVINYIESSRPNLWIIYIHALSSRDRLITIFSFLPSNYCTDCQWYRPGRPSPCNGSSYRMNKSIDAALFSKLRG